MKAWRLAFYIFLFTGQLFAQEQLVLRLNENGIMKILQMAVQYNSAGKENRSIYIPQNIYKFTIPKSKLLSNPLIPIINEISDLDMQSDLNFYLNNSAIKISGKVNKESLKTTILDSNE